MSRSQPAQRSLHAFAAWLVTLLQLVGALHFALVPHTFSAALGGVVHVHVASAALTVRSPGPVHAAHPVAVTADSPSCSADLCPTADVPPRSLLHTASVITGWVAYGAARLLGERAAQSASAQRLFPSAPKTSPPV